MVSISSLYLASSGFSGGRYATKGELERPRLAGYLPCRFNIKAFFSVEYNAFLSCKYIPPSLIFELKLSSLHCYIELGGTRTTWLSLEVVVLLLFQSPGQDSWKFSTSPRKHPFLLALWGRFARTKSEEKRMFSQASFSLAEQSSFTKT